MSAPEPGSGPFDWPAILGALVAAMTAIGVVIKTMFSRGDRQEERERKRIDDAGELASDLVKSLMGEVRELRDEVTQERKARDEEHRLCEEQLRELRHQIRTLMMKLEVLRARSGFPSAEWLNLDTELNRIPADIQALVERLDDLPSVPGAPVPMHPTKDEI